MGILRCLFLVFLSIFIIPAISFSDEPPADEKKHWYNGIILDIGVTASQVQLDVEEFEDGSKVSDGTLSTEISYAPFITAGSKYRYFGGTKFGYNIQITFSGFRVDKQDFDDDDLEDVGTSAKGYFVYALPVFFYNLGDKVFENGKGKSLKFGIGVGVGYLEVEGDIILTNLEDGSQEKHDFDVSTDPIDLAAFVMMDVRYNKWLLRISGGGPWIVNWNDEDGYEFGLFDISMSLAYSFHL